MSSQDVEKWMKGHHRIQQGSKGEDIHIFAVEKSPVYGEEHGAEKCYEISFNLGPVTFTVDVCFNINTGNISICLYAKIPLFPQQKLGCARGSISAGVSISFDWMVVSGTFRSSVNDKWLWLHYDVKVFGESFNGDLELIPLSF